MNFNKLLIFSTLILGLNVANIKSWEEYAETKEDVVVASDDTANASNKKSGYSLKNTKPNGFRNTILNKQN